MRNVMQVIVGGVLFASLGGCVSMNGNMVNADGKGADCSAKGGGIGLGMVIGAAVAAADNQLCEKRMRGQGYILAKDVGKTGLTFPAETGTAPIVQASTRPASPCIVEGDTIVRVDNTAPTSVAEARKAFFRKTGETLTVEVRHGELAQTCRITLD